MSRSTTHATSTLLSSFDGCCSIRLQRLPPPEVLLLIPGSLACIFNGGTGIGLFWCFCRLCFAFSRYHLLILVTQSRDTRQEPLCASLSWERTSFLQLGFSSFSRPIARHRPPRSRWAGVFPASRQTISPKASNSHFRPFISFFPDFLLHARPPNAPSTRPQTSQFASPTAKRTSNPPFFLFVIPLDAHTSDNRRHVHAARCSDCRPPGGRCPRRPPGIHDVVHPPYVK